MRFVLKILKGLDERVAYLQRVILILVSTLIICVMLAGVVTRFVFQVSILTVEELCGHSALWLYLIGAAYGTYERSHIKADFVNLIIKSRRTLLIVRAVATSIAVVVSGYLTVWSYDYICWSITQHQVTEGLLWPAAYFQFPILLGAILMGIYFIVETADLIRKAYHYVVP